MYINEGEALAAVVFLQALADKLYDADVFVFIDNEAAEGIFIKAYSRSAHLTVLAALFWQTVRSSRFSAWVGRVPTHLNVADGPAGMTHRKWTSWTSRCSRLACRQSEHGHFS